jgi:outer membrane protein
MIKKVLSIFMVVILFVCMSYVSYAIDIPYISFGERGNKTLDKNMNENINKKNKEEQLLLDISKPLTLRECIDIALKNSPTMKVAKINLIEEDMNIDDAKSRFYPEVGVNGSYMFSDRIDFGWEKENYNAGLDASYVIWDHGQRKNNLKQAETRKKIENSRFQKTSQSLIYNIVRAYYNLLEAEKIIAVDEQLIEISKRDVEKIKAYIENGLAIEADLATARVQQANNELTLLNDMNNLNIARANLAVIMGLDPEIDINVIDDPDYDLYVKTGLIETEKILIDDMSEQSMKSRPELAELQSNKRILELASELAKLERWPKLYANAGFNLMLDDYLRERDAIKNYKSWDAMARLTFPLFDGGKSKRIVDKAELALQKLQENESELKQNIALEVRQAYLDFERSKKALDITAVQVEDAKMSLDVTQELYELQEATLLELLDVQARYARSLINRVRAFYDYKISRRALEKAMGVLQ